MARNRQRLLPSNPLMEATPEQADRTLEREQTQAKVREGLPRRSREIPMLRCAGFSCHATVTQVGVSAGSVGTARAKRRFLDLRDPSGEDLGS